MNAMTIAWANVRKAIAEGYTPKNLRKFFAIELRMAWQQLRLMKHFDANPIHYKHDAARAGLYGQLILA